MGCPLTPQFPYHDDPVVPLRVLEPDGKLVEGSTSPMDDEQMLRALRLMLLSRAFDFKGTAFNARVGLGRSRRCGVRKRQS